MKEFNPSGYLADYTWEMFIPKNPIVDFLRQLDSSGRFDVYFNLCDGSNVAMEYDRDGHAGFFKRIFRSAVLRQHERMVQYSTHEVFNANLYSF